MTANVPVLYSFRRCPYAMRARLALLVSRTICQVREIKLAAKPTAMIDVSPKGTVPVLVLPDGGVLEQSLDIMRWSLGRHDPERWLASDDATLIASNDGPFKHHLDRYKYPERHQSDPEEHRAAGFAHLLGLETRLASTANLCGDNRGLADMAIMPFVRQFAQTDRTWFDDQPVPHLQAWLHRHVTSPLFEVAMARIKVWQPADEPVLLGPMD